MKSLKKASIRHKRNSDLEPPLRIAQCEQHGCAKVGNQMPSNPEKPVLT